MYEIDYAHIMRVITKPTFPCNALLWLQWLDIGLPAMKWLVIIWRHEDVLLPFENKHEMILSNLFMLQKILQRIWFCEGKLLSSFPCEARNGWIQHSQPFFSFETKFPLLQNMNHHKIGTQPMFAEWINEPEDFWARLWDFETTRYVSLA